MSWENGTVLDRLGGPVGLPQCLQNHYFMWLTCKYHVNIRVLAITMWGPSKGPTFQLSKHGYLPWLLMMLVFNMKMMQFKRSIPQCSNTKRGVIMTKHESATCDGWLQPAIAPQLLRLHGQTLKFVGMYLLSLWCVIYGRLHFISTLTK